MGDQADSRRPLDESASLRATDACCGRDRARLVHVGRSWNLYGPHHEPVGRADRLDRMNGATNYMGGYLGTVTANADGTDEQPLPISTDWPSACGADL